ncbi:MAG: YbaB/EbfC family nucleoid-associated protein [Alphaproteobacteria bacterium]|nr:YbaB/EbfC family nucleoid-associated protein [Alphaproteobacteria bacterium]
MLNIQGLMKQAQVMQKKMQEAQEKLAQTEVTGTSANGLVAITLNGRSEMKKISLDKSLVSSDDVEMLEDLIQVAYNDAHSKVEALAEEGMKAATGGVNLGGLKLPL